MIGLEGVWSLNWHCTQTLRVTCSDNNGQGVWMNARASVKNNLKASFCLLVDVLMDIDSKHLSVIIKGFHACVREREADTFILLLKIVILLLIDVDYLSCTYGAFWCDIFTLMPTVDKHRHWSCSQILYRLSVCWYLDHGWVCAWDCTICYAWNCHITCVLKERSNIFAIKWNNILCACLLEQVHGKDFQFQDENCAQNPFCQVLMQV